MYELLTPTDKRMITNYIESNVGILEAPLEHILRYWDEAKSGYLSALFNGKLCISEPISYEESIEDIHQHLNDYVFLDYRCTKFISAVKGHFKSAPYLSLTPSESKTYNSVCFLFSSEYLARNKLLYDAEIDDWVFQKGTKPIKVISKIAKAYNIGLTPDENGVTDLEYFRRRHSLALNTKTLHGKLCFSIHPLDYMTMSDNCNDWTSCMSWENDGEYRMGTVEMMNSPNVVVAYLDSENTTFPIGEDIWNSKKWRSLFIVDRNFIVNIKGYPYRNDNLTKEVMRRLAKLSGWLPQEPVEYKNIEAYMAKPQIINGVETSIQFETNKMYKDFGSTTCFILINPDYKEKTLDDDFNYSGESECMLCGSDEDIIAEDALTCAKCNNAVVCEECGGYISEDEAITLEDGTTVCSYCCEESCTDDAITGIPYLERMLSLVELRDSHNSTIAPPISVRYIDNVKKYLLSENGKVHTSENYSYYYIYLSDLSPDGKAFFGIEEEN